MPTPCHCPCSIDDLCLASSHCTVMPATLSAAITGTLVNDGCSGCNTLVTDSPFELTWQNANALACNGSGCCWGSDSKGGPFCTGATVWVLTLRYNSFTHVWTLNIFLVAVPLGGVLAHGIATLADADFDCFGTNVFTGFGNFTVPYCNITVDLTVTLTPAP
jgi:hypothetical protein